MHPRRFGSTVRHTAHTAHLSPTFPSLAHRALHAAERLGIQRTVKMADLFQWFAMYVPERAPGPGRWQRAAIAAP
jgi:hypothetical protein